MKRRRWPWKRKSSEKASGEPGLANSCLSNIGVKQGEEEHIKPVSFIQISLEKYEHLTALEEQVGVLNEKLNDMKEKLSSAKTDMVTKDDLVKKHAKVAEEAISGWEKAEAETLELKYELESVTLLKLTAEEQSAHLDGELKKCLKQIHTVQEESEKKLHYAVFTERKLWEKVKSELEARIAGFEQEVLNGSAELAALSRSLQERSVLLIKISEEKFQADAEIEVLKTKVQSYERETSSLKFELNISARELEIRNEEKNMNVKSAEAAHKQHIEDVKKITKLEAECQRLRSLVRKRLPGPAALAQMKLQVESLGHGFGESRVRRLSDKSSSPHPFSSPEVNVNEVEHCHKENEFLTARILAMEEESKMLKEALSKRDTELHASSSRCAKTAKKLKIVEACFLIINQQKSSLKSNTSISFRGSSGQNESNHSLASMSEDGIDDEGSCAESWASALISELSQLKEERHSDRSKRTENSNQLELMDDFLEMERLVGLSSETNGVVTVSYEGMDEIKTENSDDSSSNHVHLCVCKEQTPSLKQHTNVDLVAETQRSMELLSMIQARISSALECNLLDSKIGRLVDEIMKILLDAHYNTSLNGNTYEIENSTNQDLRSAFSWIHDFVISLYKEGTLGKSSEHKDIRVKVEEFSDSVNKLLRINLNLDGFIRSLCHLLSEIKELRLRKWVIEENCCYPCIYKVNLIENGVAQDGLTEETNHSDHDHLPSVVSGAEVVEGSSNQSIASEAAPHSFSLEVFEDLKMERDNMQVNIAELKRQLSASQKSNDLADTQLRCMTESYKLLESRVEDLKAEVELLRSKAKLLEYDLIAEKHSHQDDLAKYDALQKQMSMSCSKCLCNSEADVLTNARQDREIAAATDKLAACQETIFHLNKKLISLHPPFEPRKNSRHREDPCLQSDAVSSSVNQAESPLRDYSSQFSISQMESSPTPKSTKRTKHRSRSTSASSLSNMLNDKPGRGCGGFFSKGKGEL